MRKRIISLSWFCITTFALGGIMSFAFEGCGTNAPTKAAQVDQIIITTGNVAVKQVVMAINAGKLTQKQCDAFKLVYTAYYATQQTVRAIIEKANASGSTVSPDEIALAQSAVSQAEDAEYALIVFANSVIPR